MNSLSHNLSQLHSSPLVCICIPTYNSAATIRETVTSILAQTYFNLVVHVSDNASTDDTLKIIESFPDPRITIHRNNVNAGGEGNFNRCIQFSEGKYTAIFHADDIYEQDIVAKQVAYLEEHPNVGVAFTAAKTIDNVGCITGLVGLTGQPGNVNTSYDFKSLFKIILKRGNFIVCPSAMVRTNIYKYEIESWRGDLFRSSSDLDVWLRIAKAHSVVFLSEPLMRYRVDSNQFSHKVRLRTERADLFLVIEYYLELSDTKLFLTSIDLKNYKLLLNNDSAWRAINNYMAGNIVGAKILLRSVFNVYSIRASLSSRRDMATLVVCIFLRLTIFLGLNRLGVRVLSYFRGKLNR